MPRSSHWAQDGAAAFWGSCSVTRARSWCMTLCAPCSWHVLRMRDRGDLAGSWSGSTARATPPRRYVRQTSWPADLTVRSRWCLQRAGNRSIATLRHRNTERRGVACANRIALRSSDSMEHLWSPADATNSNPSQMHGASERLYEAKSVATSCHQLRRALHGKEGVSGSSPEEGSAKPPQRGNFWARSRLPPIQLEGVWSTFWNTQI